MPLRTLVLLCLASLLVACSSEPPKSAQPQVLAQPKTGMRVELRGRASQSGQLILHLPSRIINQPTTQALGTLAFVKAP